MNPSREGTTKWQFNFAFKVVVPSVLRSLSPHVKSIVEVKRHVLRKVERSIRTKVKAPCGWAYFNCGGWSSAILEMNFSSDSVLPRPRTAALR
jgi:hypothetical protein